MVSVASLLNHESEHEQLPTPTASTRYSSESSPAPSERPSKKPRLAKDAAIFQKSKVVGTVRYSPYEANDATTLQELERLKVYPLPLARIAEFPRHIPYNSDKKQLYLKTGRDAFEVFQYTFQPPGHDRSYAVLWDYNIGLVRMTPFFKCNHYPKTVPSKMLNLNPGLREICHSITGGALVAQGYWVPYEAAKALAATFCWEFRYALVPVFGAEFPGMCARPGAEGYSTMTIDESVIRKCTQDVERFRAIEQASTTKNDESSSSFLTRNGLDQKSWYDITRSRSSFRPINRPTSMPLDQKIESSYPFIRTPIRSPESSCVSSPVMSSLNSIGTPASMYQNLKLPSPREILDDQFREVDAFPPQPSSYEGSDSDMSPKSTSRKRRYPGISENHLDNHQGAGNDAPRSRVVDETDIRAAQILVDLSGTSHVTNV